MIDFSQVDRFATRLARKASTIEAEATDWQGDWGDKTANAISQAAPRLTGHLASSVRQVEPGGITMADYWIFVERGTAHQAPQPFVRPALNRVTPRATRDALDRGVRI